MILHTVNASTLIDNCLPLLADSDTLLLLGEAVNLISEGATNPLLLNLPATVKVYAMNKDCHRFDVTVTNTQCGNSPPHLIDHDMFVALCIQYPLIQNWY